MSEISVQQALLSEQLLLLRGFGYSYPEPNSHSLPKSVWIELQLLDAVASVLTSRSGDTFAATLDKSKGSIEIILAKSPDKPTLEDKEFAKEFFALIIDPNVKDATDVFPLLLKHHRDYINVRIRKLHAISTDDKFNQHFLDRLVEYVSTDPELAVVSPRGHSHLDMDKDYKSLLKDYLNQTKVYSEEDLDESFSDAHATFSNLYIVSETLASSAFMQNFKGRHGQTEGGRKARKFVRHSEKLGRYVRGIRCILKHAKRLFPSGSVIPHRWVEDTFTGTGEGEIQLVTKNAYETISRASVTKPLPDKQSDNLDKVWPSNRVPWQPLFAYLHPEIRIILSSLVPEMHSRTMRPIGLSKQLCLGCMLWIQQYNSSMLTRWVTSDTWVKADPTFALSGDAYLYMTGRSGHERNKADPLVKCNIGRKLLEEIYWVLKKGYHYK